MKKSKEAEEIETDLRNMVYSVTSGWTYGTRRNLYAKIAALVKAVRADEREACAKVAEHCASEHGPAFDPSNTVAAAIRGRKNEA